ncbi:hypothetical protein [Pseudarthrobacter phenanthrenivorans]|nr:hypothetical protein [Pseudarthrobacter phenanthrenivorans]
MPKSKTRKRAKEQQHKHAKNALKYHFSSRMLVSDLERISASGTKVLAEHLGHRMTLRRSRVSHDYNLLPPDAWQFLAQIPKADTLLELCSQAQNYDNSDASSKAWNGLMRKELHAYVNVVQHLRSGLDYAFLAGSRLVFERWTTNRALSLSLEKREKEPDSDFYSRIWEGIYDRSWEAPGKLWAQISEVLHGRSSMPQISREYADLFGPHNRPLSKADFVTTPLKLAYTASPQMLAGLDIHAKARGISVDEKFVHGSVNCLLEKDSTWTELLGYLKASTHPSDIFALTSRNQKLEDLASTYDALVRRPGSIAVLQNVNIAIHSVGCLAHHRVSQLNLEREHLEVEISKNQNFSIERYGSLLYRYSAFSEMALLLGSQDDSYGNVALRTAGMALDSAWRLWLDDDDLSMACMRAVFEQTSRARAHRRKPPKAFEMETRKQTPQRWLEAAAYRRLGPIGRALGEFSHYTPRSMREDARRLITEAQENDSADAPYTARGHLLTQGAYFLATEIAERLALSFPHLHGEFLDEVALADLHDEHDQIEDYLAMVHDGKDFEWSGFDFLQNDSPSGN